MSDEKNSVTIRYTLISQFDYSVKGDTVTAEFIELTAPTSKNMYQCADLKQAFFRAISEHNKTQNSPADSEEDTKIEDLTPIELISALYASNTVDMKEILGVSVELFKSGVAKVDGETKLTKPLIDEMSTDDLEGILGEYLLNFILASSLNMMKSNI